MLVDFGQKVVFFSKCVNIYVSNYFCIYLQIKKMEDDYDETYSDNQ